MSMMTGLKAKWQGIKTRHKKISSRTVKIAHWTSGQKKKLRQSALGKRLHREWQDPHVRAGVKSAAELGLIYLAAKKFPELHAHIAKNNRAKVLHRKILFSIARRANKRL